MKITHVFCKKDYTYYHSGGNVEFLKGKYYRLHKNENFENNIFGSVNINPDSVYIIVKNNGDGLRFTLENKKVGELKPFKDYFCDIDELRQRKLERLNK